MTETSGTGPGHAAPASVEFYWRPGCGFCSRLAGALDRIGIGVSEHNIWSDPGAAAFVRSVANGNETVPTVRIGDVALVNPSPDEVLAVIAGQR